MQPKRSKLVPMMKTLRKDGKRASLRFDKLATDEGTVTFNLQINLVEKLEGERSDRSKYAAGRGHGTTRNFERGGDNDSDSDSNVWGNLNTLQHRNRSRRHGSSRGGSLAKTRGTCTERRQWARGLRSEVRQQHSPAVKRRAGARSQVAMEVGVSNPQRMDTDRSA